MTRIEKRFEQLRSERRKAFIPYITAGDPSLDITLELVLALDKGGADLIELGVPFSDPIADGPVIQRATDRALRNGVTLRKVLELGENIRKKSEIPLVLFSYFNPLLNHGLEKLAKDAVAAGFDGVLASDLTIEESDTFVRTMRGAGLNTIFLVAPTSSPERMKKRNRRAPGIGRGSQGFLANASDIHGGADCRRVRNFTSRTRPRRVAGSRWSDCGKLDRQKSRGAHWPQRPRRRSGSIRGVA